MPLEKAAQEGKTRRQTIYNWLKRDGFRNELKRLQDESFSEGITRIKGNVSKAVDTLVSLLDSGDDQIKVRAAEGVIEYAAKLSHNEDLEKRIALLEERLREAQPWRR